MGSDFLIWQLFSLLLTGGVVFLVIRLLIIKNFPRKKGQADRTWIGIPPYSVNIYWRADDARFIAEVPDLPGCAAEGATQAEALANAALAADEWLSTARKFNRPIPDPSPRSRYV